MSGLPNGERTGATRVRTISGAERYAPGEERHR